jgi:DNA replication initiation complex subunit (GINS family)
MSEDSIITYESLYELLRNEKYKQEIQPLEKDFYEKVVRYLRDKKAALEAHKMKDSIFAPESVKRTKRQLENVQKILKDLYDRREGKIIQLAMMHSRTGERVEDKSIFLPEELKLYGETKANLDYFRSNIVDKILNGEKPKLEDKPKSIKTEEEAPQQSLTIRFIEAVPKFMAEDLNEYGPYEPEQVSRMPYKSAQVLIKRKRAELI